MGKFNINFSDSVYKLVGEMALDRGTTMSDVIRDAVSLLALIDDELRVGHKIAIDMGNGKLKEIMFPWARSLHKKRPELPDPQPIQEASPAPQPIPAPIGARIIRR